MNGARGATRPTSNAKHGAGRPAERPPKAIVPRAGLFIHLAHLPPIIGRITYSNCQRTWPVITGPTQREYHKIFERCFSAEGVKFGGVLKNNLQHLNNFRKTSYIIFCKICFCAAGKEIGGVRKNNSSAFAKTATARRVRLHLISARLGKAKS